MPAGPNPPAFSGITCVNGIGSGTWSADQVRHDPRAENQCHVHVRHGDRAASCHSSAEENEGYAPDGGKSPAFNALTLEAWYGSEGRECP